MYSSPLPAHLRHFDAILDLLEEAAVSIAREMRARVSRAKPRRRGATLRPGVDTPHWLALVREVRRHLRRRGTKALLARELGLHRSQVSKFFGNCSAMPDAERTLLLLGWLVRRGREEQREKKISH